MVLAFVLLWIFLGLGVFFVAMRGGPRGARESLHTDSRLGGRAIIVLVAALFVFGIVVPVLVLVHNNRHGAANVVGLTLTANEVKGRELFAHTCTACHTLAAVKSVGRIGPDLDVRVGEDISTAAGRKALVLNAIAEGRARGLGQMPALLYQGKEAEDVASFVAAVAGH